MNHQTFAQVKTQFTNSIRVGNKETCPCCSQDAKYYKRSLSPHLIKALRVVQKYEDGITGNNISRMLSGGARDAAFLAYWDLIKLDGETKRWSLTTTGKRFLNGQKRVPKYAIVYAGSVLDYEGEPVSIKDFY